VGRKAPASGEVERAQKRLDPWGGMMMTSHPVLELGLGVDSLV
jgi:hypothetical protein